MCSQLQDAERWMGLDEKREGKNPTRPCPTDWPQKQQSFLAAAQMFLGEGCTTTAPSHIGSGGTAGKRDSSLLPPSCKSTLSSSHWFLMCVLRFLWVNMALPRRSYHTCEIQGVMKMHLNMQRLLSDSLWIGRSHFNQDGEHLHSSLWIGFF